jgi:hypothetical protein
MINFTPNQIALQTFIENGLIDSKILPFATSIANWRNPSSKQLFHIDRIVKETLAKENPAVVPAVGKLGKVFDLFDKAIAHKLHFPKISLQFLDPRAQTSEPFRLSMSRKNPNIIWVDRSGFGSAKYGRIDRSSGCFYPNENTTLDATMENAMIEVMHTFAEDPANVAAAYGKLNHNCCFCTKPLDTAESLGVGYGPICAKHFGLPWGKNTPRTKPVISELVEAGLGMTLKQAIDQLVDEDQFLDEEMNGLLVDQ